MNCSLWSRYKSEDDFSGIALVAVEGETEELEEVVENIALQAYYDKNTSEIIIKHDQEITISKTDLYNIVGQKIMQVDFTNQRANVSLSTGIYILKFKTLKGNITRKVKIQ